MFLVLLSECWSSGLGIDEGGFFESWLDCGGGDMKSRVMALMLVMMC